MTRPAENQQTVEAARKRLEARLAPGWKGNHADPHEEELDRAALRDLVAQAEPDRVAISTLDWCIGYADTAFNREWGARLVEKLTEVRARLDGAR